MQCPYCGSADSKVTDSRTVQNGIRRRRECLDCQRRFTTYERIHTSVPMVIKRDSRREEFDREKLASGIRKACAKRPVPAHAIDKLVEDIEGELQGQGEVAASHIGEAVMEQLKNLDRVAYIRWASVYRDFQDIDSFEQAVKDLREGRGTQLTLPHIEPGPSRQRRRVTRGATGNRQTAREVAAPDLEPKPEPDQEPGQKPGQKPERDLVQMPGQDSVQESA
ncbi:MAG: transcriptional repressor NrdR [Chloroflexi bacterium]|nr:transcriptional repressor NrdR [Chloroflexota bacterium]